MSMSMLEAEFVMRYPRGAVVEAALAQGAEGFSVTALFGPSGCGKTTILRCLAGLERPSMGRIRFGDEVWLDAERGVFLPPQRRGVGMLFQEYALFPHLTVEQNVGYGVRGRRGSSTRGETVGEVLERFGLAGLEDRYPHQISGGQQQRVALARAVMARPRLLLLDEPLAALDSSTRQRVRGELRQMLRGLGIPVVLVTHDWIEAAAMADHVVVLDEGRVRQSGPMHEVFSRPVDLAVAEIVGVETVVRGEVVEVREGLATAIVRKDKETRRQGDKETGVRILAHCGEGMGVGPVYVCIRAENVVLERDDEEWHGGTKARRHEAGVSARNRLSGVVTEVIEEGPLVRVRVDCGFVLNALLTKQACEEMGIAEGSWVVVVLKATGLHLVERV
jgi:molybdate transport system ATP-binding protein